MSHGGKTFLPMGHLRAAHTLIGVFWAGRGLSPNRVVDIGGFVMSRE